MLERFLQMVVGIIGSPSFHGTIPGFEAWEVGLYGPMFYGPSPLSGVNV